MGVYFSNLHIRKDAAVSADSVRDQLCAYFLQNGYREADPDSADFEAVISAPKDSRWISVYSEACLHTDVLELCSLLSERSGRAGYRLL